MLGSILYSCIEFLTKNSFYTQYNEITKNNNIEDVKKLTHKYLKIIVNYSYKNVPYYKSLFSESGVIKNDEIDLNSFMKIPILNKTKINQNREQLVSKTSHNSFLNSTGGSTGEPLTFLLDKLYNKWRAATLTYYYKELLGIDELNAKKVILWGSIKDVLNEKQNFKAKFNNYLTSTVLLNSFILTEENMKYYAKIINRIKPRIIRGYASSLNDFANFLEKNNISIYSPEVIISAADTLYDHMRLKIENVFGTKVFNYYGTRECGPIAGECTEGLLHQFIFNNYSELEGEKLEDIGNRLIITNLHNYSMPFIRYDIGDLVVCGPNKCKCGCQLPTFKKVIGRLIESFIKKDGSFIPGEFFIHLIGVEYNYNNILKFQVVQDDYEKITINAVIKSGSMFNENIINEKIKIVMGHDCKIVWNIIEDIPKQKSGKYLYTYRNFD